MYAKDTNRPPEERELLIELSQNRNMRAALAASFAAYLIAMKYIYMALSAIGVGGGLFAPCVVNDPLREPCGCA